ncbi:bifunctional hydroxymethylpyrimidine kinase/phosphomethylpyrimidine kinase [Sphingomonas sp. AP4-R1]|uniref:bifunctional hydroxymethylpyrimidine kinase/phosphomethylpyrimidine kinase n=1 Tax=Sphingomonas sp. AP4-R1 TaxID=2735134 RepID=UPI001493A309|nr:bifunctional hydroxymethylpyrimidine kinase/phosphomethylpyrimidine kinase [Sphingomonas sp. AP4-R1]
MTIPRILSIAGSDSGGGAGIQADIKTITMLGGHALTAITALTAQNTLGVTQVTPVSPEMVVAQIDAVVSDIGVDAIKIGMIGSPEVADAVADRLTALFQGREIVPIVFDPVMISSSGAVLADPATIAAFGRLMRLSVLVTPNLPELAALAGADALPDEGAQVAAAIGLVRDHQAAFLVKGGHAEGLRLTDRLVGWNGTVAEWSGDRIETPHTHGTGCTLSSAIATGLGAGLEPEAAITRARFYVRSAIEAAPGLGAGHGPMGHGLGREHFRSRPPLRI